MKQSFFEWCITNNKESLLSEWDLDKNEKFDVKELGYGSHKKVWWKGNECAHQWEATIKNRTSGTGCPLCLVESGRKLIKRRTLIKGENDLATEHPELLKEWDFKRNEKFLPSEITSGSRIKVWWICPKCNQSYRNSISDRVRGRECPNDICRKKKQSDNIKKALLERRGSLSQHNPELVKEWHPTKNGVFTPEDINPRSDVKVWWLGNCGHEWEATPSNRVRLNSGCPICSNKIILVGFNDLATTHKDLCFEWDYEKNRDLLPTEIVAGTHRQVWWVCSKGHSFKASISNRSKNNGTSCPHCDIERKTSFNKVIYYYLKLIFEDIQENYRPEFLNKKELDIFIPSLSLAIEYDGEYYHKRASRDIIKNQLCRKNGIEVIRIREPECPILPNEFTCFIRKTLKENELKECIEFVLNYINDNYKLNLKIDIDLIRDRSKILEMYLISEKENSLEFINPELAKEWHPTKNGKLTSDHISYSSNKSVWRLGNCGHEWEAKVNNRLNGNGCPICYESTGRKIVLEEV